MVIRTLHEGSLCACLAILLLGIPNCSRSPVTSDLPVEIKTRPRPDFFFTIAEVDGGTVVFFDASGSSDANDPVDSLMVRWNWDDDIFWDTEWSKKKTATHVFDLCVSIVSLEVKDLDWMTRSIRKEVITNSGPPLKWQFEADWNMDSSPAIGTDGTIYIGSMDRYMYAVNPDGTLKWRFLTESCVISSPALGPDGGVYFSSLDGHFYALDANGNLIWKYPTALSLLSSPAIDANGRIYFTSTDSCFYAFEADGTLFWKHQTTSQFLYSPTVAPDGTIYFVTEDGQIYAFTPDGNLKWEYQAESRLSTEPAIGYDGIIFVGSWDGSLYSVYPDGSLRWRVQLTNSIRRSSPVIDTDGTIYIGSGFGKILAVSDGGELKWESNMGHNLLNGTVSAPTIGADGYIYVRGMNRLKAFDNTGRIVWAKHMYNDGDFTFRLSSPVIIEDGTIYTGSGARYGARQGFLWAFSSGVPGLASSPWPKFRGNLHNTGQISP